MTGVAAFPNVPYTGEQFKDVLLRVRKYYVYSLWVGRTCFYVGKGTVTRRHAHRALKHEKDAVRGKSPKDKFIRAHLKSGGKVTYVLEFDSNREHHVLFHEQVVIGKHGKRSDGGTLFNLTDGGQGMQGYELSEETKQKMSASRKGMRMSPEGCKAIAEGRKSSPLVHAENMRRRHKIVLFGVPFDSKIEAAERLGLAGRRVGYLVSKNTEDCYVVR